ncbi:hexokinase-2 isoform X2 [Hydra vulgaris]|uniref:Phosphotransferase n=1 Tax=Hydra vulgaris TaxID=6087 RepID=A0ABM4BI92_HYDVU
MYLSQLRRADLPGRWEKEELEKLFNLFELQRPELEKLITVFQKDIADGLSKTSHDVARCKMLLTYVQEKPNGTENGNFFALDLGGSNFRVLLVQINDGIIKKLQRTYPVSKDIMNSSRDALFGYIAECLASFVKETLGENHKRIEVIGFTFSFPVKQTSLTKGTLIKWTKGYNISGVVDHDIIQLLSEAIEKQQEISVGKIILLNDTTGVMMCGAYDDPEVEIGLILGTGSNACYMEKLENIEKFEEVLSGPQQFIVNMEWGAFGERDQLAFVATKFDLMVDEKSIHPGQQIFEKMISGMYLGELVRLCIVELIQKCILFHGVISKEIQNMDAISSEDVSVFCGGVASEAIAILCNLGYKDALVEEILIIQDLCFAISRRSATLTSAGLAALIRRMGKKRVSVAIDGSLFKNHPTYKMFMYDALRMLLPTVTVKLVLAEDGSGKGAALVAAVVQRLDQPSN